MQHLRRDALGLLAVVAFVVTAPGAIAADAEADDDRVMPNSASPDGKWECRRTDIHEAAAEQGVSSDCSVVRAGTKEPAVELPLFIGNVELDEVCTVLWAPDSKRFAYNYRAGGRYESTAVYQLRDGKWTELRSLKADETSKPLDRAQNAQLMKRKLPKDSYRRRIWDTWHVERWADARTAILYVYSNESVTTAKGNGDTVDLAAHFLFTIRFDERGNWRVIKTHQMSEKEVKARDAASQASDKAEE